MSTHAIQVALDQMEAWLADPDWVPDSEVLATWDEGYRAALQGAQATERGLMAARAHHLGDLLEVRMAQLVRMRDDLRAELDEQDRGHRALRAYQATILKS